MKFAVVEYKQKIGKLFSKKILYEELFFEDKSFYYIQVFEKDINKPLKEKEIIKLKKLLIRLDIQEIIYKGSEKISFGLKDNNIRILDCSDFFIDFTSVACEKIIEKTELDKKQVKIFLYDPFLKYGKNLVYKLSKIASVVKIFTFKTDEAKEISKDIMNSSGACVLYTDYMEKIEDYKIIILTANTKGFFADREISKDCIIFSKEKQRNKSRYNIIDAVDIKLPEKLKEYEKFDCSFQLICAFLKYNFINFRQPDIISFSGYDRIFSFNELKGILNNNS